MKNIVSILSVMCLLLLSCIPLASAAADEIVILYENDVHGAVDGYAKLAAMKQELAANGNRVGVVSCGDYMQGSSLAAISQGAYIVELQNLVGYDAIIPGNHEFDYRLSRLQELTAQMNTKPVSANFQSVDGHTPVFEPYTIVSYGDTDIAYIGVTTPDTLTSSSPTQFLDEDGNYRYTFRSTDLYEVVQGYIDEVQAAGADYVIALTHLGTEDVNVAWSAQALVQNTDGLDAVLDGHSHSVIESMTVEDKSGRDVPISSTGTKFAYIGKLTVSADGTLSTALIPTDSYEKTDEAVNAYLAQIREEYAAVGERRIGESLVTLRASDEDGNRLVRTEQTNLGDFCADAFRAVTGADIGVVNGGGLRADLPAGEVTFNDILNVFPFNNTVCMVEVTGQQIVDLLEFGVMYYPSENGSFQHVSGLTFTLDASIPSSVVLDENDVFIKVDGAYRVQDVRVCNADTDTYEPLDPDALYTLASHNYLLLDRGGGASMLNASTVLLNNGMLDVELLEIYITEYLGGVIGEDYAVSQGRITVKEQSPATTTASTTTATTTAATTTTATAASSPQTGDETLLLLPLLLAAALTVIATARVGKSS